MKVTIEKQTIDCTPTVESVTITPGDEPGDVVMIVQLVTGTKIRTVMRRGEAVKVRDGIQQVMQPTVYFKPTEE